MSSDNRFDAIVIGSGPNGLAAAIRLALEGLSVKIFEAESTIGGGTRTLELTEPGFLHDICSAIHPMAYASPFLKKLPLGDHGLEWIHPEVPLAHPMPDGSSVVQFRQIGQMKDELGRDFRSYEKLLRPLIDNWESITPDMLAPLRFPSHPFRMAMFGLKALQPANRISRRYFQTERARALFGGIAAHSIQSLDKPLTSAIGMLLGAAAHSVGWPMPRGGSQMITHSMADYFVSLGGEIETNFRVENLEMLPKAKTLLFSLTPRQVLDIVGDRFPDSYRKKLQKYRYGSGVFKIDYLLKEPVPWSDSRCLNAGTIHVGGTYEEIAASEKAMSEGRHPEKPYVLIAQQSLFDDSRTPDDRHTLWAYCHVPNGSTRDMTTEIENQIERFAPGFKDVVEKRVTRNASQFQLYNANYIGGDINGGIQDIWQHFSRPVSWINPYATPAKGIYFSSSSTPPGGAVHGMCGFHAAQSVLRREYNLRRHDWQFSL